MRLWSVVEVIIEVLQLLHKLLDGELDVEQEAMTRAKLQSRLAILDEHTKGVK